MISILSQKQYLLITYSTSLSNIALKNILIISPSFSPINSADMHRVRQSISYFREFGWNPIILTVKSHLVEGKKDSLLTKSIPSDIEILQVDAFSTRWTRKVGLGNLGLRSLWFYWKKGNQLFKEKKIDLIYFSTTVFPVMILGNYWKKKFNIPYIIDMQDPWHSDYYLKVSKNQRPPKFWFSYFLNKFLEPIAMRRVSGIISVSKGYCDMLEKRYKNIKPESCRIIPFGAYPKDFEILGNQNIENHFFRSNPQVVNVVYVGRGGHDMEFSISAIFMAIQKGLKENETLFNKLRLYFIGTSYASHQKGIPTIAPLAKSLGIESIVEEHTQRVSYFESLQLLKDSDILLIAGSMDANYTASKLYPYILSQKPILAVFNENSSVVQILRDTGAGEVVTFNKDQKIESILPNVFQAWCSILKNIPYKPNTDWKAFEPYTAREMTRRQALFFDEF